jgi:hypothetical protein
MQWSCSMCTARTLKTATIMPGMQCAYARGLGGVECARCLEDRSARRLDIVLQRRLLQR